MKTRFTLLALSAACTVLAACTPGNSRPGAVPTAIKTGQSWVVTRPLVAAQVLDTCSRDSPAKAAGGVTGYWAPGRAVIDQLEANLDKLSPAIASPGTSNRQYVGIESQGQQRIYINAFPLEDNSTIDPAREAIRACDGGSAFWGAVYDPQTGLFSDIVTNGN